MDHSLDRFSQSLPAYPGNVATLRRGVVRFAESHGATPLAAGNIALAVGEALNNVVMHAYRDQLVPGAMTVEAHIEGRSLAVAVIDEGIGLSPRTDSAGLGLGMPVMASLTASMSVGLEAVTDDSGTVVILNFGLA